MKKAKTTLPHPANSAHPITAQQVANLKSQIVTSNADTPPTTPLPANWRIVPLRSVCQKTSIWNPAREPRDLFRYIDVSSVSNEYFNIAGAQELSASNAPSRARKIVKTGDVIYATVRPTLRRIAQVGSEYDNQIVSTAFCVIRADCAEAVPEFLYFALLTDDINQKIAEHQRGASYPAVTDKDILNQSIPLPPLPEQERIAAILWKIQQAIETEAAIIRNARDLKKSLLRHLFTHGLRNEPLKDTEIGKIPESWEVVPAVTLFKLTSGKTRPKDMATSINSEYQFPVFGGNGVMGYAKEYLVNDKSLVIGRVGEYCGTVYVSPARSWITDNALYSQAWAEPNLSIDYVASYLRYYDLNRFKRKSSQPLVSQGMINQVLIPIPERKEREHITHNLQTVDDKINTHEAKQRTLQDLFKTMLNKLMTGQIPVAGLDIAAHEAAV